MALFPFPEDFMPLYFTMILEPNLKQPNRAREGKSPKQIESLHVLDPAGGSGSFLIAAVDLLFNYHLKYYESYSREAKRGEARATRIYLHSHPPPSHPFIKATVKKANQNKYTA